MDFIPEFHHKRSGGGGFMEHLTFSFELKNLSPPFRDLRDAFDCSISLQFLFSKHPADAHFTLFAEVCQNQNFFPYAAQQTCFIPFLKNVNDVAILSTCQAQNRVCSQPHCGKGLCTSYPGKVMTQGHLHHVRFVYFDDITDKTNRYATIKNKVVEDRRILVMLVDTFILYDLILSCCIGLAVQKDPFSVINLLYQQLCPWISAYKPFSSNSNLNEAKTKLKQQQSQESVCQWSPWEQTHPYYLQGPHGKYRSLAPPPEEDPEAHAVYPPTRTGSDVAARMAPGRTTVKEGGWTTSSDGGVWLTQLTLAPGAMARLAAAIEPPAEEPIP
ncbi:hypothetical protein E2320_019108 [Naja naja]|nr:hypothetical protein E2320_019108 [Naja naja]